MGIVEIISLLLFTLCISFLSRKSLLDVVESPFFIDRLENRARKKEEWGKNFANFFHFSFLFSFFIVSPFLFRYHTITPFVGFKPFRFTVLPIPVPYFLLCTCVYIYIYTYTCTRQVRACIFLFVCLYSFISSHIGSYLLPFSW